MLKRLALATVVAGLAITATAAGHTTSYPSAVSVDYLSCLTCDGPTTKGVVQETAFLGGHVTSPKAKCVPGRKVKLFVVYGVVKRGTALARQLVDVDRTSLHGAWSGVFQGSLLGVDHFEAKLIKKNIGPRGHRHICKGDRDSFFLIM